MDISSFEKTEQMKFVDPAKDHIPYHLEIAIKQVYETIGMKVAKEARETESAEYGACRLEVDGASVVFRVAKITPIKVGQFVTIWKRPNDVTMPLDSMDDVDFVMIAVNEAQHQGQFVFNKKILIEKGIMSDNGKKGKMAIRVYPPWTVPAVKQAIKTQQWQLRYFFPFGSDHMLDPTRIHRLFQC